MKRIPFLVVLLFLGNCAFAQSPDAWINYSQPYYKIPVGTDAIYRLSYADLQQAGFPVDAVDPKNIQLIHRGLEQAISVSGESDSRFDPSDYIEFFGRRNDGTLDAQLYKPSSAQPHPFYNLYSDTTAYFLTIGGSVGKRMQEISDTDLSGSVQSDHHMDERRLIMTEQYSGGVNANDEIFTSSFDEGEGWTGIVISQGGTRDYTLTGITGSLPASPVLPTLELMLVGRNPGESHQAEIYVGPGLRPLATISLSGFTPSKTIHNLQWSDITAAGELKVQIRVPNHGSPDRVSVSYAIVKYPQQLDAASSTYKVFGISANASGKSYVQLSNTLVGSRLFDITDPGNPIRVESVQSSTLNAVLPFSNERKLLCTSTFRTPSIARVQFQVFTPGAANYIIISHPVLRTPAAGYSDPVRAYAAYRASPEGGGYDTLIVNAPALNDQFNYGEHSPAAIFNFMRFISQSSTPKYLFLIGKGLEVWYNYNRNYLAGGYRDLVPTSGYPASDMFFSVGLGNTNHEPAIPTGRLTASSAQQVANYLNKIKEHETLPFDQLWRKKLLHLSGGIEEGEPEEFKGYLENLAVIAQGPYLGGQVSAIAKLSRDIQLINIAEQVNAGVNLITFFGHSSPSTLDFDIGYVSDPTMGYNNKGKYPMLLMNGCQVGTFFLRDFLFGEDWVLAADKGATGFIAHSSFGINSTLNAYSNFFYEVAYGDSTFLDKGIGDIQSETARRYIEVNFPNRFHLSQIQQMILLGDPAVKLFGTKKSDLEISVDNVQIRSFDNNPVTVQSDSFAIEFVVRNFGMASQKPFRVEVTRTLNDNRQLVYDSIYQVPAYADTLIMVIRQTGDQRGGNNSFNVVLDPDFIISELNEDNNTASIDFVIPINGTKNLFPHSYGIVNSTTTFLSFQTTDVFSGTREFLVEVDTTTTFTSEFKKTFSINADVLGRQEIELLARDTLPYYWRTRLANPLPGENEEWTVSSFTYIDGNSEGWAQVAFEQFADNVAEGIMRDESLKRIRFEEKMTTLDVLTFGAAAGKPADSVSVKIDGQEFNLYTQAGGWFGCRDNTVNLIAFDKNSTVPYVGIYLKWYELPARILCGREPFVINSFTSDDIYTGNNNDIIQYVDNIAEGDSVLLYNIGDARVHLWPPIARAKLAEFGISDAQLSSLTAGAPFVIKGKKGAAPGTASVFTSSLLPANTARLEVKGTITGGFSSGTFTTPVIGPAVNWDKVTKVVTEVNDTDVVSIDIVGIRFDGTMDTLLQNVSHEQEISSIDASEYPFLKLVLHSSDPVLLTPAQLSSWIVLYTPAPEGVLLPGSQAARHQVEVGRTWQGDFRFVNISDKSFSDSLIVKSEVFNQSRYVTSRHNFKIKPPGPGDTTEFHVPVNTVNKTGLNDLTVRVNPFVQAEVYYDNNVFQRSDYIEVQGDQVSPLLDVTVDGRLLLNGDFVSASPSIKVRLLDENPFSLKQDTTGMRIFLTYPCVDTGCDPKYIALSREDVQWKAATSTSPFTIEFSPENLPAGKYFLKVEGQDASGNHAAHPYEISFVVENSSTLEIIPPYPNPVLNTMSFGFTLGGGSLPDKIAVTIFDYTGRFSKSMEIINTGQFYVGTNHFEWPIPESVPNGFYVIEIAVTRQGEAHRHHGKVVIQR